MVTGYRYHMHVHDEYVLDSLLPYIFLQPYQCSQSRNTESPRQGVRGSESFRVIRSGGIPYSFWLKGYERPKGMQIHAPRSGVLRRRHGAIGRLGYALRQIQSRTFAATAYARVRAVRRGYSSCELSWLEGVLSRLVQCKRRGARFSRSCAPRICEPFVVSVFGRGA